MIAITGASGNLGKATLGFLLQRTTASNIVAIVRDADKMKEFADKGVQVRVADYNDLSALTAAMQGVDTLLQISASSIGVEAAAHEKNVVTAATQAGVKHIVYTSTVKPEENAHFMSARQCLQTELDIAATGIPYTFFRNSMYMETIPQFIGGGLYDGNIRFPAGDGKVSFASRIDIAEALANVLTTTGHENKRYEITGSTALGFKEIAETLAAEKQLPATYTNIPAAELQEVLTEIQMPNDEAIWFLTLANSVKHNEFSHVDTTLETLLQRKPLTLNQFIKAI